ncbi:hypothetical protein K501DRAFT_275755 [Backusella circina FSU 941]|nr:hypothetical protein K501DRAFT_275755 [Backusella circina FSU 941]
MAVGKLNVTPVTLRGIRSGFADARFFVGCFVQPGEKHRTHALEGSEPHWTNQLTCNISEGDQFLNLELVNESPNNGGIVASGKVALKNVFNDGSETRWAPLQTTSGESFGELQLKLSFDGSSTISSVTSSFGDMNVSGQNIAYQSTTTQSYTTSHGHSDSRQSSFSSLGPANPIPQNYGAGNPPPFTPPAGGAASYSAGNNTMPGSEIKAESQTISTGDLTKEEFEEQKARGNIPSWVKYGGGALGAAAAVGLAAWGAHELKEHYEKKEEESSKYKHDSKPHAPPPGHFQQQPSNQPYAIENHGQKKDSFNQSHHSEHKQYSEHKQENDYQKKEKREKKKGKKHGKKHGSDSSSSDSSSSDSDDDHKKRDSQWR